MNLNQPTILVPGTTGTAVGLRLTQIAAVQVLIRLYFNMRMKTQHIFKKINQGAMRYYRRN